MYETSLREVIRLAAKEQAYREQAEKAIRLVVNSKDIIGKKSIDTIEKLMSLVEGRSKFLEDLICEDYEENFMHPCYDLFINESIPKNLKTVRETEDFLLIEFEADEKYPYFQIQKFKALEEVETAILDRGSIAEIKKLIVIKRGSIKDFEIALSKNTYLPTVRWYEDEVVLNQASE